MCCSMCYSVMHIMCDLILLVAACCSVLQYVLQCVAVCVAVCCSMCYSVMHIMCNLILLVAVCCSVLQYVL